MIIGVPRETAPGESRVALVPDVAARLKKKGWALQVETGAGARAFFDDQAYAEAGASLVDTGTALGADVVLKVQPPSDEEIARLSRGASLISFLHPLDAPARCATIAAQGVTAYAMELVPRITRAQKMDALSAMSSVAGYRAVLLGAERLPKFFPLLTTAAGTLRPARVLVLGAGVAGLQALATARRLGAETSAYDIRPAAAEEARSLGAKFVELDLDTADSATSGGYAKALDEDRQARQIRLLAEHVALADVVICTALIPGRAAPVLVSAEAVAAMRPGSVIVDLAAANGGNCPLSRPDETVVEGGVTILGPTNPAADMPLHASQMYARTVAAAVEELLPDPEGSPAPDFENEITKGCCVTCEDAVVHERVSGLLEPAGS